MNALQRAPLELSTVIREFWPEEEWDNAAAIAEKESGFNAFALHDTTTPNDPCGSVIERTGDILITAEKSVGYFQINACNIPPDWDWHHLYNARHNAGTAHQLWDRAGGSWSPWYYSAQALGLN